MVDTLPVSLFSRYPQFFLAIILHIHIFVYLKNITITYCNTELISPVMGVFARKEYPKNVMAAANSSISPRGMGRT